MIRGPAVIGAGVAVDDAYVGPFTSIGDGAQLDGAEIEDSIVCAGAVIRHVSGRIEQSVVGHQARLFRDFGLPKTLRLVVGDGTEVALA